MPPRRPKSRVDLLADCLTALREAIDALSEIDLRRTPHLVRDHIKTARADTTSAANAIESALQADVPTAPSR